MKKIKKNKKQKTNPSSLKEVGRDEDQEEEYGEKHHQEEQISH